ncbi:hypothetical protein AVEN_257727-1 [Araneus ventricosus]|uniref:Uncharacterized protein n=1 Tax=Araneus ventricosus TaxID=182803 RepID=A0A4Y2LHT8_ARAVE|nr:hypothetical protein AVEN_257727-1 [Araneus ventricosus]
MYATTRQAERLVFQLYPFHAHKTEALQRPAHGAFHPHANVTHQTSGLVVMSARQLYPIQPLFTLVTSQRKVESVHIDQMNEPNHKSLGSLYPFRRMRSRPTHRSNLFLDMTIAIML